MTEAERIAAMAELDAAREDLLEAADDLYYAEQAGEDVEEHRAFHYRALERVAKALRTFPECRGPIPKSVGNTPTQF
jgi:hypothetical protein